MCFGIRNFQLAFWLCNVVTLYFLPRVVCGQSLNDPTLRITELVGGLSQPRAMAFIDSNDLLVLQKADGRVRRVTNGILQTGSVLDVNVDSASERGLLGIAVHPDFPRTPLIYLYFTESTAASDTSGCSFIGLFSPEPV
jgi:glucose/arabinose dehydrogenase